MRVVSLNLDHGDATVVRRAIRQAIDACRCDQLAGTRPCTDCQALRATLLELDRLVQRPALGRTPLLTLVAANRCLDDNAGPGDVGLDANDEPGLRLLAGEGGRGAG